MAEEVITPAAPAAPAAPVVATPPAAVNWAEHIPAELASEGVWTPLKDKPLGDVLKGYAEAQKLIGGSIRIPTDQAATAEWDQFFTKLGRPAKPEDYKLTKPEKLPDGVQWDEATLKEGQALFHSLGLNQTQAQKAAEAWVSKLGAVANAGKVTEAQGMAQLKESVKGDEKKLTALVEDCRFAVAELGDAEFVGFLDSTGAGNHPAVVRFLAKIGAQLREDSAPGGNPPAGGPSQDEARMEIAKIRNDKANPYHKGDPAAIAAMDKLYQRAYGTVPVAQVGL